PQWQKAHGLVTNGSIGQLRTIHSHFSYNNREPENIRNSAMMGGGALMDIGCYSISLSRHLFASEPLRVLGQITPYAGYEVDCFVSGILEFADGSATFTASTKIENDQYVKASGEAGSVTLPLPFSPIADTETHIFLQREREVEKLTIASCDHYRDMADDFALSIFNDKPVPTPLSDALANMKVIDAIFAS